MMTLMTGERMTTNLAEVEGSLLFFMSAVLLVEKNTRATIKIWRLLQFCVLIVAFSMRSRGAISFLVMKKKLCNALEGENA
jgi:hypothetical protein